MFLPHPKTRDYLNAVIHGADVHDARDAEEQPLLELASAALDAHALDQAGRSRDAESVRQVVKENGR